MHKLNPKDLPELKVVDLTVTRAVLIFISVTLFFVMPVLGITYVQNTTPAPTPQVAGVNETTLAATSSTNVIGIDLNSQAGLLLMIGIILVGIALIVTMFMIVENVRKQAA